MKKIFLLFFAAIVFFIPHRVNAVDYWYQDKIVITCPDLAATLKTGQEFSCYLTLIADTPTMINVISFDYSLSGLQLVSRESLTGWKITSYSGSTIVIGPSTGPVSGDFVSLKFKVTSTTPGDTLKFSITNSYFMINSNPAKLMFDNTSKQFKLASSSGGGSTNPTPSCSTNLAKLLVDGNPITGFDASKADYSIATDNASITITPSTQCTNAKISGSTGTQNLNYGANALTFTVTNPSGTKKNYNITVTRRDTRDQNNNLSALSVHEGIINFEPGIVEYSLSVPYAITNLNIVYSTESEKSTAVLSGDKNIEIGDNVVTIAVTSESGLVKTYTINVTRLDKPPVHLTTLEVENYNINFDPAVTEYYITGTSFVKKLNISYVKQFAGDTVVIVGNEDLVVGKNVISVKVVDENLEEVIYTINYTQESKDYNIFIMVAIVGLAIGLGFAGFVFLRRRFKPRRFFKKFDDEDLDDEEY